MRFFKRLFLIPKRKERTCFFCDCEECRKVQVLLNRYRSRRECFLPNKEKILIYRELNK